MNATNERRLVTITNESENLELNSEAQIHSDGRISINGNVRNKTNEQLQGWFNYDEASATELNRSWNGNASIQDDAYDLIDTTVAAIKAEYVTTANIE